MNVIDFDLLNESMYKCFKGVSWKPSVKAFRLNSEENLLNMNKKLTEGTWKNGKPKPIMIMYPKKREGLSISFRDRIYQRSINDNELYPKMTNNFIYSNCACQKNKGTDFARKLVKKYLWNYYCNYGLEGYVIQIDIEHYYQNMLHEEVEKCIKKRVDNDTFNRVAMILNNQYAGDIGYKAGSQMVQIAGISFLNDIDHYIKEQLHIKHYIRYMDDLLIFVHDLDKAKDALIKIEEKLEEIGLHAHPKKTHIIEFKNGFKFLGFNYKVSKSGKIIMTLNSQNIKRQRKKLYRMLILYRDGKISKRNLIEQYRCWKNNAMKGNSYKLTNRIEKQMKEVYKNEICKIASTNQCRN